MDVRHSTWSELTLLVSDVELFISVLNVLARFCLREGYEAGLDMTGAYLFITGLVTIHLNIFAF